MIKFQNVTELRDFLNLINRTLDEGVKDGADRGGTYQSNTEGVLKVLNDWIIKIERDNEEFLKEYPVIIVRDISGQFWTNYILGIGVPKTE